MEEKGFKVAFIDGKVHVCHKNFKDAFTLEFRGDGLYQIGGSPLGELESDTPIQCELWHHRFSHLHYKSSPGVRKMVTRILEFHMNHEGIYQDCVTGKHTKGPFPYSERKTTDILQLIHSNMSSVFPITSLGLYSY